MTEHPALTALRDLLSITDRTQHMTPEQQQVLWRAEQIVNSTPRPGPYDEMELEER